MLVCTKHKVLLFHEMNWWNINVIPLQTQRKTENMTLAFNFYRPVNSQAITHPPPLQSEREQQLGDEPPQARWERGSIHSSRTISTLFCSQTGSTGTDLTLLDGSTLSRGITRWQFHHGHVQFVTSVVRWWWSDSVNVKPLDVSHEMVQHFSRNFVHTTRYSGQRNHHFQMSCANKSGCFQWKYGTFSDSL